MSLNAFIASATGHVSADVLFTSLHAYLSQRGFAFFSYHITAAHLKRLNLEEGFIFNNFPEDWVAHYTARGYYAYDPIILTAGTHASPFHWFAVGEITRLTPEQKAYLEDLRSWGFRDGIAIPIFGAKGTTAYFGAGSKTRDFELDAVDLNQIQLACHFAHKRYLELYGIADAEIPDLSPREVEVLTWIAKGKSAAVIAEILGVTDHTIDTLTRRIYQKLDVNERISAVLKALGAGLITI